MLVTLLGTGSADGWPNPFCECASCVAERRAGRSRRPSSALVDGRVLIDCGPGATHAANAAGVSLRSVEHVLLTHGHPDHLDPAFLLTRRWTSRNDTPRVGTAAGHGLRDWLGPDSMVELHVLAPGDDAGLQTARGTYAVRALPAQHAHGDGDVMAEEALLYAITAPDGARLLYATDTGRSPATAGLLGTVRRRAHRRPSGKGRSRHRAPGPPVAARRARIPA
jgi:adenosylcobinamide kinase/adenosylcobinamide-phosphate guanylyltransferase